MLRYSRVVLRASTAAGSSRSGKSTGTTQSSKTNSSDKSSTPSVGAASSRFQKRRRELAQSGVESPATHVMEWPATRRHAEKKKPTTVASTSNVSAAIGDPAPEDAAALLNSTELPISAPSSAGPTGAGMIGEMDGGSDGTVTAAAAEDSSPSDETPVSAEDEASILQDLEDSYVANDGSGGAATDPAGTGAQAVRSDDGQRAEKDEDDDDAVVREADDELGTVIGGATDADSAVEEKLERESRKRLDGGGTATSKSSSVILDEKNVARRENIKKVYQKTQLIRYAIDMFNNSNNNSGSNRISKNRTAIVVALSALQKLWGEIEPGTLTVSQMCEPLRVLSLLPPLVQETQQCKLLTSAIHYSFAQRLAGVNLEEMVAEAQSAADSATGKWLADEAVLKKEVTALQQQNDEWVDNWKREFRGRTIKEGKKKAAQVRRSVKGKGKKQLTTKTQPPPGDAEGESPSLSSPPPSPFADELAAATRKLADHRKAKASACPLFYTSDLTLSLVVVVTKALTWFAHIDTAGIIDVRHGDRILGFFLHFDNATAQRCVRHLQWELIESAVRPRVLRSDRGHSVTTDLTRSSRPSAPKQRNAADQPPELMLLHELRLLVLLGGAVVKQSRHAVGAHLHEYCMGVVEKLIQSQQKLAAARVARLDNSVKAPPAQQQPSSRFARALENYIMTRMWQYVPALPQFLREPVMISIFNNYSGPIRQSLGMSYINTIIKGLDRAVVWDAKQLFDEKSKTYRSISDVEAFSQVKDYAVEFMKACTTRIIALLPDAKGTDISQLVTIMLKFAVPVPMIVEEGGRKRQVTRPRFFHDTLWTVVSRRARGERVDVSWTRLVENVNREAQAGLFGDKRGVMWQNLLDRLRLLPSPQRDSQESQRSHKSPQHRSMSSPRGRMDSRFHQPGPSDRRPAVRKSDDNSRRSAATNSAAALIRLAHAEKMRTILVIFNLFHDGPHDVRMWEGLGYMLSVVPRVTVEDLVQLLEDLAANQQVVNRHSDHTFGSRNRSGLGSNTTRQPIPSSVCSMLAHVALGRLGEKLFHTVMSGDSDKARSVPDQWYVSKKGFKILVPVPVVMRLMAVTASNSRWMSPFPSKFLDRLGRVARLHLLSTPDAKFLPCLRDSRRRQAVQWVDASRAPRDDEARDGTSADGDSIRRRSDDPLGKLDFVVAALRALMGAEEPIGMLECIDYVCERVHHLDQYQQVQLAKSCRSCYTSSARRLANLLFDQFKTNLRRCAEGTMPPEEAHLMQINLGAQLDALSTSMSVTFDAALLNDVAAVMKKMPIVAKALRSGTSTEELGGELRQETASAIVQDDSLSSAAKGPGPSTLIEIKPESALLGIGRILRVAWNMERHGGGFSTTQQGPVGGSAEPLRASGARAPVGDVLEQIDTMEDTDDSSSQAAIAAATTVGATGEQARSPLSAALTNALGVIYACGFSVLERHRNIIFQRTRRSKKTCLVIKSVVGAKGVDYCPALYQGMQKFYYLQGVDTSRRLGGRLVGSTKAPSPSGERVDATSRGTSHLAAVPTRA